MKLIKILKEQTDYEVFFRSALEKFNVNSPDELDGDKKIEFFDYVDKNWDAGENETDVDESLNEMKMSGSQWKAFYEMAKDTTGKTLNQFEKKYSKLLDLPHIKDGLENTKNFAEFYKHIKRFDESKLESVTEGKDDFVARHTKTDIFLKKGYKHYSEEALADMYAALGNLVKGKPVKRIDVMFEGKYPSTRFVLDLKSIAANSKSEHDFEMAVYKKYKLNMSNSAIIKLLKTIWSEKPNLDEGGYKSNPFVLDLKSIAANSKSEHDFKIAVYKKHKLNMNNSNIIKLLKTIWSEKSVNESVKIKKGMKVKIMSAADMKSKFTGMTPEYLKYNQQIAGKTVTIKRAFRGAVSRGSGPINQFSIDGYGLYNNSGFDVDIIQSEISESINDNKEIKLASLISEVSKGHYEFVGNQILVDSNFVNSVKGVIPNSELVHLGMGDFALKTPMGSIEFHRSGNLAGIGQDFVGRVHRVVDKANQFDNLLSKMKKAKKVVLSMSESSIRITKKMEDPILNSLHPQAATSWDRAKVYYLDKVNGDIQKTLKYIDSEIKSYKSQKGEHVKPRIDGLNAFKEFIQSRNESINEHKFIAFWKNDQYEIEASSLWDAKQKAIAMLKIPKSKQGLLGIMGADSYKAGDFRYENITNENRRSDLFFDDSTHGKAIHSLLKGKWDRSKVKRYFDTLGAGNDQKWMRIIEFIAKDVGIDPKKWNSRSAGDFVYAVIDKIEPLYKDFIKNESVKESRYQDTELPDKFQDVLSKELSKNFKGGFRVVGYDLFYWKDGSDPRRAGVVLTIDPNKDSVNSIVKSLKSKIKESVNESFWPKSKLSDTFASLLDTELKKNFKGKFWVIDHDLYHWKRPNEKLMTIDGDKDSVNSIISKLKSNRHLKESNLMNILESKYDIGFGKKGSGVTVWNRNEDEAGDYKNIAHISDSGKITYYDKAMPNNIKKQIEAYAEKLKIKESTKI